MRVKGGGLKCARLCVDTDLSVSVDINRPEAAVGLSVLLSVSRPAASPPCSRCLGWTTPLLLLEYLYHCQPPCVYCAAPCELHKRSPVISLLTVRMRTTGGAWPSSQQNELLLFTPHLIVGYSISVYPAPPPLICLKHIFIINWGCLKWYLWCFRFIYQIHLEILP